MTIERKPGLGSPQPVHQSPRLEQQRELQRASPVAVPSPATMLGDARPLRTAGTKAAPVPGPSREIAPVMLTRLDPLIQVQVELITAALEEAKLKPEDVQAVLAFNLIGVQDRVCSYCGRPGCGYRPVTYAKQNQEINLLEDDFVVASEALARAGVSYATIVYDENAVVLRELGAPNPDNTVADLELMLQRFRAFEKRKSYPDPANRAWLDSQLAQWKPEHATAVAVGSADDIGAIKVASKLFEETPGRGGPKFFSLATSVAPSMGLTGQEFALRKAGVFSTALAVGKNADAIAGQLFEDTAVCYDVHQARETIGGRIGALVQQAQEQGV